jgi:kynureninase
MAAIKASLDLFNEVGMDALRQKSVQLTSYLEYLINNLDHPDVEIISPKDPAQRGCQLSIRVKNADQTLHKRLTENHVITDWREPGVIRCAPVPFYNSFEDVFGMVAILKTLLD